MVSKRGADQAPESYQQFRKKILNIAHEGLLKQSGSYTGLILGGPTLFSCVWHPFNATSSSGAWIV
eukprot:872831-Amphidinium_carterae.1